MDINFKFKVKPNAELLKARGLEPGGKVQKFIDSEVLRLCDPLVPFDTGMAKSSGVRHTTIGSGEVRYRTPYIRRLYYNKNMNFQGAPQRGAQWFERMKANNLNGILSGANKIAGGRYLK